MYLETLCYLYENFEVQLVKSVLVIYQKRWSFAAIPIELCIKLQ